jgi:electron transport complex protein RnfD
MSSLHTSAAPHINSGATTHKVMRDVVISLLPATVAAVVLFGFQALLIVLVCVASAMLSEFLFNLVCKKKQTLFDFSAIVTGLILALNLSTKVPLWQCALGSAFAIIVVKCLFGGLGKNIANPAIAARVFMLLAFGATVAGGANTVFTDPELVAGATPLIGLQNGEYDLLTLFLGNHGGTIGETCTIALLLGYAYLVWRGHIKWYVPFAFVATVFGLYFITTGDLGLSLAQVLAGGLLFGAIFMATDYVTTPLSKLGKVVFCIGCGVITFAIRTGFLGGYPEGVSIAILFMNLLTPLIEKWTNPRTLGGVK